MRDQAPFVLRYIPETNPNFLFGSFPGDNYDWFTLHRDYWYIPVLFRKMADAAAERYWERRVRAR